MDIDITKGQKIGSRILGDHELNILLPNHKQILTQLENIREVAKFHKHSINGKNHYIDDKEFAKHHNNVFSILGDRGSGKTSVLLTMKHTILNRNENKADIILPIIVPEDMGKNSEILGWLIGYLGDEALEVLKKLKQEMFETDQERDRYFPNCIKNEKTNPLSRKYRALQRAYLMRSAQYKEVIKNEFVNIDTFISESKEAIDADKLLRDKFESFLYELLKCKSRVTNQDKESLLLVFFDDVDISSDRCVEVLSIIMRYLSYPNIAVFLAGNYQNFHEIVTIDYLKKDGILSSGLLEKSYCNGNDHRNDALSIRQQLSYDYLKKVLSPAFRYTMPKLTDRQKAEFIYTTAEDNSKNKDQRQKKANKENLLSLIERLFKKESNSNSFLRHTTDNNKKDNVIYSYFKIFDNTPRGLINIYYLLIQLNKEKENKNNTAFIKTLYDTIIDSSAIFVNYRSEIEKIIIFGDSYFIDYEYLYSFYLESSSQKNVDKLNHREEFIAIFILAHFIHHLLNLLEQKSKNVHRHGAKILCNILNSANSEFILYPDVPDTSLLLMMYYLVNNNLSINEQCKMNSNKGKHYSLQKYLEAITSIKDSYGAKWTTNFKFIQQYDSKWMEQLFDNIHKYGDIEHSVEKDISIEVLNRIKSINADSKWISATSMALQANYKIQIEDCFRLKNLDHLINRTDENIAPDTLDSLIELYLLLSDLVESQKQISDSASGSEFSFSDESRRERERIDNYFKYRKKEILYFINLSHNRENWKDALDKGDVEYISFKDNFGKSSNDLDEEIIKIFSANDYCKENNFELFKDEIPNCKLIQKKYLGQFLKNSLELYFKNYSEYQLIVEYFEPELNVINSLDQYYINLEGKKDALTKFLERNGWLINKFNLSNIEFINSDIIEGVRNEIIKINSIKILSPIISIKEIINNEIILSEARIETLIGLIEDRFKEFEIQLAKIKSNIEISRSVYKAFYYLRQLNRDFEEKIKSVVLDTNTDSVSKEWFFETVREIEEEIKRIKEKPRYYRDPKMINNFSENLKILKNVSSLVLSNENHIESQRANIIFDQIFSIIQLYIAIKKYKLFEERNNDDFYKIFSDFYKSLIEDKNMLTFRQYIENKKNVEEAEHKWITE